MHKIVYLYAESVLTPTGAAARGGSTAVSGSSPNTSATTGHDRKKLVMDESDPYMQQGATLRVNQSGVLKITHLLF